MSNDRADSALIFRVHEGVCALPLRHVIGTMRPRPKNIVGTPQFVRGLAVIRGALAPVVDAAELLVEEDAPSGARHALPPLPRGLGRDFVLKLSLLDEALLLVLQGSYPLSDEGCARLDSAGTFA